MKIAKNMGIIVLVLCLCLGVFSAFADSESSDCTVYGVDVLDSGKNPYSGPILFAEAHCGSYATHDMLAAGWGDIYNVTTGTTVVSGGACAQCTRCHLVIVTQGDPPNQVLGYYTTWQPGEKLSSQYTIIRQSSNNIKYTSAKTIAGIAFRYA